MCFKTFFFLTVEDAYYLIVMLNECPNLISAHNLLVTSYSIDLAFVPGLTNSIKRRLLKNDYTVLFLKSTYRTLANLSVCGPDIYVFIGLGKASQYLSAS